MATDIEITQFFQTLPYFLSIAVFMFVFSWLIAVVYTKEEKVDIICRFLSSGRNAKGTAVAFNAVNAGRNVRHKYVLELFHKFNATGSVNRKKGSGRLSNEAAEIGVLGEIHMNGRRSLRLIEEDIGKNVTRETIRKILKKHKFKPYKQKIVHELGEGDPDRRIEYCEVMSEKIIQDPDLIHKTCFSDECVFFLDGRMNTQNSRYWAQENPREFYESRSQYPQKLNVWAGIFMGKIVGPFFFEQNLTGQLYLEMLEQQIVPRMREIAAESNLPFNQAFFQQDGAPPHYSLIARNFLSLVFPGRWIGRRGSIEWPPRSPDLTPLDFWLWGHLKTVVYNTKPADLMDLRTRIETACQQITPEQIGNVYKEAEQRLYFCMEVNGEHIEHLL